MCLNAGIDSFIGLPKEETFRSARVEPLSFVSLFDLLLSPKYWNLELASRFQKDSNIAKIFSNYVEGRQVIRWQVIGCVGVCHRLWLLYLWESDVEFEDAAVLGYGWPLMLFVFVNLMPHCHVLNNTSAGIIPVALRVAILMLIFLSYLQETAVIWSSVVKPLKKSRLIWSRVFGSVFGKQSIIPWNSMCFVAWLFHGQRLGAVLRNSCQQRSPRQSDASVAIYHQEVEHASCPWDR